jgi:predicted amidohydrolase YtcJ
MTPGFDAQNDGREELYKVAVMAARRKYPLEIHAYTDDAARQILDVFERVSQTVDIRDLR